MGEDEVPGYYWFEEEKYVKGKQGFREEFEKNNFVNKTHHQAPLPLFPSLRIYL